MKAAKMALLLTCLASFSLISMGMAQVVGTIAALNPSVTIERNGRQFTAKLGDGISIHDVIRTGISGRAKIIFEDEVMLIVVENSAVEITEHLFDEKRHWRDGSLGIQKGLIRLLLKMYGQDSRFIINSGNAIAGAKGTDFLVRYDPNPIREITQVYVLEGVVEVKNRLATVRGSIQLTSSQWSEVRGRRRPEQPQVLSKEAADLFKDQTSIAEQVTKESKKNFKSAANRHSTKAKQQKLSSYPGASPAGAVGNTYVDIVGQDSILPAGVVNKVISAISNPPSSGASRSAGGPIIGGPVLPLPKGPAILKPSNPKPPAIIGPY